ncbi:MAG: low molecular weight protein-tyrosine-phosphatase [Solirubrobacteraceae bacterium]
MRILFVCLGNICRSPTAEGVMRHLAEEAGIADEFVLDSAGMGGWHTGDPPDPRSREAARRRGIVVAGAARQVSAVDFHDFDLILAMDRANLRDLRAVAPADGTAELRLLREYDENSVGGGDLDVPDPYYGGPGGFDDVLDIVEAGCRGLLADLRDRGVA